MTTSPLSFFLPAWRRLLAWLALLLWMPALALAQTSLQLDSGRDVIDAWPAVTVMTDPGGAITPEQALAQTSRFAAPTSAQATLGVHKDVVWLRIPVAIGGA